MLKNPGNASHHSCHRLMRRRSRTQNQHAFHFLWRSLYFFLEGSRDRLLTVITSISCPLLKDPHSRSQFIGRLALHSFIERRFSSQFLCSKEVSRRADMSSTIPRIRAILEPEGRGSYMGASLGKAGWMEMEEDGTRMRTLVPGRRVDI